MLLEELSWPQINSIANELPVVIPIAAVEQHGRHLPVLTDSMLLGEVVRRGPSARGPSDLDAALMAGTTGLIPCEDSSAGRQRLGHVSKQGNTSLRFLLGEAAQAAARRPGWRSVRHR